MTLDDIKEMHKLPFQNPSNKLLVKHIKKHIFQCLFLKGKAWNTYLLQGKKVKMKGPRSKLSWKCISSCGII